jgi:hypothetical protein
MGIETTSGPFRTCGACKSAWPTWDGFVQDPAVRFIGLQSVAVEPDCNLLVFEHGCGSSVSVLARRLRYLLPDAESVVELPILFATGECRGHCHVPSDLETCDAPCGNVRDRSLILLIQCLKQAADDAGGWE